MYYYLVIPTIKIHQTNATLTYSSEAALEIGSVVLIEIGKKQTVGVVINKASKPDFATKPIERKIENRFLPSELLSLAKWLSQYYHTHTSIVWQNLLPRGIEKSRRKAAPLPQLPYRNRTKIVLNKQQKEVIRKLEKMSPGTALLQGITGSGKTQVYIELAKKTINEKGRSVIILIPEIALTTQTIAEFSRDFKNIIVTHSRMSEAQRHLAWQTCLNSDNPILVIGPRSALFSPLKNIGLIVIDECHEPSFKQNKSPRYSALRAAAKLASYHKAKLVLGSATPNISDYYLAKQTSRPILKLTDLATPKAIPAKTTLVDMTKPRNFTKHRFLSNELLSSIVKSLSKKEQVLIFHNRRGTAPITLCNRCGWTAQCPSCFVPLVLHADKFKLTCHICGHHEPVPTKCPECNNSDVIHKGIGTKLVAEELSKKFPEAIVGRFDGDSKTDEALERQYKDLYEGKIDIIVGTQIVAKGLDLPKLSTVGIVQADSGLALPDFQASERVFQLVMQACGRAGRANRPSAVIVQTYQPNHPSIKLAISSNYDDFYKRNLEILKQGAFPPFVHLLKLTCIYKSENGSIKAAKKLAQHLRSKSSEGVSILGPTPAFYERIGDTYRWQLVVKSHTRKDLLDLLNEVPDSKWQAELDPINLL